MLAHQYFIAQVIVTSGMHAVEISKGRFDISHLQPVSSGKPTTDGLLHIVALVETLFRFIYICEIGRLWKGSLIE
jgi:hypothetical protein